MKLLKTQIKEHRESITQKEFRALIKHATSEEIQVDAATIVFIPTTNENKKGPEYYRKLKENYLSELAKKQKEAIL